jgi:CCR4-NOT complex subunit CAF16
VLLLDEVTVDLDVVARANLLQYLADECEERGATIVYATHIFDGLDRWATHIARIRKGELVKCAPMTGFEEFQTLMTTGARSPLLKTVMGWLRTEKEEEREARLKAGEEKPKEVDLKLSDYGDTPFAGNRMYNRTA